MLQQRNKKVETKVSRKMLVGSCFFKCKVSKYLQINKYEPITVLGRGPAVCRRAASAFAECLPQVSEIIHLSHAYHTRTRTHTTHMPNTYLSLSSSCIPHTCACAHAHLTQRVWLPHAHRAHTHTNTYIHRHTLGG